MAPPEVMEAWRWGQSARVDRRTPTVRAARQQRPAGVSSQRLRDVSRHQATCPACRGAITWAGCGTSHVCPVAVSDLWPGSLPLCNRCRQASRLSTGPRTIHLRDVPRNRRQPAHPVASPARRAPYGSAVDAARAVHRRRYPRGWAPASRTGVRRLTDALPSRSASMRAGWARTASAPASPDNPARLARRATRSLIQTSASAGIARGPATVHA